MSGLTFRANNAEIMLQYGTIKNVSGLHNAKTNETVRMDKFLIAFMYNCALLNYNKANLRDLTGLVISNWDSNHRFSVRDLEI